MAWVAVHENGTEIISSVVPVRGNERWDCYEEVYYDSEADYVDVAISLPKGSIKKLIGRDLTWENEPVELKEDTIEKITIDMADYHRYLSYANYIQNWAGTVYTCPKCGALNPEGYICINCHYNKSRKLC